MTREGKLKLMTPKQRAVTALQGGTPDMVPTMEIDFELTRQLLGEDLVLGQRFRTLSAREKKEALNKNIDLYIKTALKLDYSAITVHPTPTPLYTPGEKYYETLEDELYVIRNICREAGDFILVAAGIDATYPIPDGASMVEFSYSLADRKDEMLDFAKKNTLWAVDQMKQMIDAGAGVMYNCSDYCFNTGPFLSPAQFEIFIYPFLKMQTAALRKAGAFVIKHTDGNIAPIMDMLLDCNPHCIHSVDPLAGMDIAVVKKQTLGRCALMGNVDSTLLQQGDRQGILRSAKYALENGMPGGGYIFSTCNSVFKEIRLEDYLLMLRARREYGKY